MGKILVCENLTKVYNSDYALNNVSIHVNEGELLVIVGSSGSGKSTLLNMIGGIDRCTSGNIYFEDEDITKYSEKEITDYRKNNIGFIYQTYNLINELTVYENILLTCTDKSKIDDILKKVNLYSKKELYPKNLSGGEQQRIAIARALSKDFDILLCDEPTGALDSENSKQILLLLEKLCREYNKTIIIVTHNNQITKIADRVYTMKNGVIISEDNNKKVTLVDDIEW